MEYLIHIAVLISIYSILGISLDLVLGFTGLLSVTHAAFYGLGAYATAILLTSFGMNFFLAVLLGIIVSGVIALGFGIVLSRFRDDFYALASMGFNTIVFSVFLNWQSVTRGPLGIPGIDRPSLFGFEFSENIFFLILCVVFATAVYFISRFITNSSFGRVLLAIRENEEAISVFGYNTVFYKLLIFVISAMMASVAGALYATYVTYIDPSSFSLSESIFILAMIIVGGLSNHRGAILGAVFVILLPEVLRFVGFPTDIAAQMRQLTYGVLLIAFMLYRPKGLVGKYEL